MAAIELEGGAAIDVCPMPDAQLTVESRTLAAPARPPAAEKDDIDSYNAKMLNIMQAAFKKVVQAKSTTTKPVTPAEGTWEASKRTIGTTGSIYNAKIDGEPCIVKCVKSSDTTPLWRLVRELYVQACCSTPPHPNVCRLLGWHSPSSKDGTLAGLEEGAVVYMVQENAGEEINKIYSPNQAYRFLEQIVRGLYHLHSQDFYHRDLKVENVALSDDAIKLIDFGSSTGVGTGGTMSAKTDDAGTGADQRLKHIRLSQKVSTRAPEVVLGKQLDGTPEAMEKLDVWGLGIVLFGMVFGYAPFGEEAQDAEAFDQSANNVYKLSWGENCPGGEYPASNVAPPEVKAAYAARDEDDKYYSLKRMLDGMLAADPGDRWKLEQVMAELKIQIPIPLSMWLQQNVTHPVSGKDMEIGDLSGDFLEAISGAKGPDGKVLGAEVDVGELGSGQKLLDGAALDARLAETGKKGPVLKKLFARLHYELNYPLTDAQAKKIKVKPHKAVVDTAETGVPPE